GGGVWVIQPKKNVRLRRAEKTLKFFRLRRAENGTKKIDVICPAFATDCLETLEEIAIENKAVFMAAGGEQYEYIPALNDDEGHVTFLAELIKRQIKGWH
ncbi:MAG: ferrochelatase, partial [Psychrosphaera sp.]|nr:ferrochelatase [Psychrosphaera sp.]